MNVSNRKVVIGALFVTCLLTANIVGQKVFSIGPVVLPAAVIIFPFSYIFGDVLTEVFGYRWARKVIWLGFGCNLIFVIFASIGQVLPPAPGWEGQAAYETILGATPRLLAASFCGYFVGEFTNSFIMAKMKLRTRGRWLWTRTITSTFVGEGLDSAIWIVGAYYGAPFFAPILIVYHWLTKTAIETVATPLTYTAVNYLKKKEGVDVFDNRTNFNPFRVLD